MKIRMVVGVLAIVAACAWASPLLATDNQDPALCWDRDWQVWVFCSSGGPGVECWSPSCGVAIYDSQTQTYSCTYVTGVNGSCECSNGPNGTCHATY